MSPLVLLLLVPALLAASTAAAPVPATGDNPLPPVFESGRFRWKTSGPLLSAASRPEDPCISIKDPTIVQHDGRWHLFATIRSEKRTHQIEYLNFAHWNEAASAPRHVLTVSTGYFCAPQVLRYAPHDRWYLIYQASDPTRKPSLQPVFSTTTRLSQPDSWSPPELLFDRQPTNITAWIDFWVICDEAKAHLFFTSLDGRLWRSETSRDRFPRGWDTPRVVLQADIFEASHTYRLQGTRQYLTLVEAQGAGGRRYYKAYLANRLDGGWKPLADSAVRPFAGADNVVIDGVAWTQSFSHGELLRAGTDEYLDVEPSRLRFLFQGVLDADRQGRPYGRIPWRLGLLEPEP